MCVCVCVFYVTWLHPIVLITVVVCWLSSTDVLRRAYSCKQPPTHTHTHTQCHYVQCVSSCTFMFKHLFCHIETLRLANWPRWVALDNIHIRTNRFYSMRCVCVCARARVCVCACVWCHYTGSGPETCFTVVGPWPVPRPVWPRAIGFTRYTNNIVQSASQLDGSRSRCGWYLHGRFRWFQISFRYSSVRDWSYRFPSIRQTLSSSS